MVKSESDNEYANEEHNTELPSEAPGAVVCGNTLRNNNATMFVNIATRDNHGDAVSSPEKDFPLPTDNATVHADRNIYYFCTINYNCQGGSMSDCDHQPIPSPRRKRARTEQPDQDHTTENDESP